MINDTVPDVYSDDFLVMGVNEVSDHPRGPVFSLQTFSRHFVFMSSSGTGGRVNPFPR